MPEFSLSIFANKFLLKKSVPSVYLRNPFSPWTVEAVRLNLRLLGKMLVLDWGSIGPGKSY